VQALVFDGSGALSDGPHGAAGGADQTSAGEEHDWLRTLLDAAWIAVAAVANGAFIPANEGGRIVLVAPGREPGGGGIAEVAASALENLARTLSVEWARYRITITAVAPAAATAREDLETMVAYLLSPAGAYFSGTRLDLDLLPAA
jgi:NAD(P)-dependent dehydrogenase (short-subunit alcohol dehydrogenase family)